MLDAGFRQRTFDLRNGVGGDVVVLAREEKQERDLDILRRREARRISVRKPLMDVAAVERDRRLQAGHGRRDVCGRSAEAESHRRDLPLGHERLLVQPRDRRRDVGAQRFDRDLARSRESGLQTFLGIWFIEVGMRAMVVVDSDRHVARIGNEVGDSFDLGVDAEDLLQHDDGGLGVFAVGTGEVARHRASADVDRDILVQTGLLNGARKA